jgi:adenosylhomocysteine nucleosidase/futalosine hydrolase
MGEEIVVGQVVEVVEDRVAGLPERFSRIYTSEPKTNYQAVASLSVSHSEDGYLYSDIDSPYPLIEQMEGASVSAVAEQLGVEFLHLRAISNRVGDPFAMWEIGKACEALAEALTKL